MKSWIKKIISWFRSKQEKPKPDVPPTPPVADPAPEPEPEKVNKGGQGLYKPESNLYLCEPQVQPWMVQYAGETSKTNWPWYPADFVKFFRMGSASGPRMDGTTGVIDFPAGEGRHAGKLKFREAKVTKSGNTIVIVSWDGALLQMKTIQDRNVRQE